MYAGASPRLFTTRLCAAALAALACVTASAEAAPIPDAGTPSLPRSSGSPAKARSIPRVPRPEQNPFMTANPSSNIHNDTWMTDAYRRPGPLGRRLIARSEVKPPSLCGSITFDSRGRILTVCPSTVTPPQARIIDPDTLETLSTFDLPTTPDTPGTLAYQNFTGGGYFFVDARDRIWVATRTDHLYVLGEGADSRTLTLERDYDLTSVLDPATERISSALPDFDGLIWFVSKANGKVGTLNPGTGSLKVLRLGEEIENSFAIGSDGVYIVSDRRMYRFRPGANGAPRVIWSTRIRTRESSSPVRSTRARGPPRRS